MDDWTANTPAGQDLLSEAQDAMSLFADTAIGGGPMTAGYFCAVADLLDGRYAIAVGPEAKRLSDGLFRLAPTRFVAPAMGNFRKDLQSKRPGIYLIGKDIQGPYSVEDAADHSANQSLSSRDAVTLKPLLGHNLPRRGRIVV